ncbi:MAG: tRNA adenosine deaminase-associated protein [Propionibacteriaceae bacterium]|jgi:putative tRNA adenosine deaminase-associated protein|nr:tRNA adenosine deaminase-associated protein [Propionibacteriaceae bacterium]
MDIDPEAEVVEEDDFDDDDDYPEDATEDDVDFVLALYHEDEQPVVTQLEYDLANDLDALIGELRRIPGEAGTIGMVSIAQEVFALIRVRGKNVQVYLSDAVAANDWPIARDIVDFIGEEVPDEDDESMPVGDAGMLADAGLPEFELEAIANDYDTDSSLLLQRIAKRIRFGPQFAQVS